jgi:predicted alpha-1,2-mannosidase
MRARASWSFVALAVAACAACSSSSSTPSGSSSDAGALQNLTPTRPADPAVTPLFVGTGGFGYATGSAFPGATAPQGIAKLGPDTTGPWGNIQFLHCSGYWYGDGTIQGFGHMHLHGTGVPDYGVLGIMPVPTFSASTTTMTGYQSDFDKSTESATPGKYTVTLENGGILVEMTATPHAGHHRYTYPAGATTAHVVLDLDHHIAEGSVSTETITLDPTTSTFTGSFLNLGGLSGGFGGTTIYFAGKTAQPWTQAQVWSMGAAPAVGTTAQGTGVGVDLDFALTGQTPVEIQVGLSFVSTAAAAANLAAEMPTFAFDQEAKATAAAWQQATSVIQVQGGTAEQQEVMQAAIYHTLLMPSIQSDVAGTYTGLDGKVATAQGFHYVSELSEWDIYRSLAPLWDLIEPARALDMAQSLVAMANASGAFPKWPLGDGESGCMIGASAEVILADAYVKGITGFDAEGAYQIMQAAAMGQTTPAGGRGGMDQAVPYMQLGYVPAQSTSNLGGSVSVSIEYAQDDAALAQLATALGHTSDAATLSSRLHGWQKLYDSTSGLLWAKSSDGSWASQHSDGTGYTEDFDEANGQQSVWGPWYDIAGLEKVMGGPAALVTNLEAYFESTKTNYDAIDWTAPLSYGGHPTYDWPGNEPSIHIPYIFALAGRPDLTQKWLPWIEGEVFTAGADGIPGNDDAGTMSAWLIESMLGFYAIPATDQYVIGAPVFTHATLAVQGGTFTIEAPLASAQNVYVQSVTLNGQPLTTPVMHHKDFKAGGSLTFVMGAEPSSWGQGS